MVLASNRHGRLAQALKKHREREGRLYLSPAFCTALEALLAEHGILTAPREHPGAKAALLTPAERQALERYRRNLEQKN